MSQPLGAHDPVILAIRSGIEAIKEVCRDLLPTCEKDEIKAIQKELDVRMKNLIKSEQLCQENTKILAAVLEEHPLPESPSEKQIFDTLEKIKKVSLQRAKDFEKEKCTDNVITRNTRYIEFKELVSEALAEPANSDNEEETEEEEEEGDLGDQDEDMDVDGDEDDDVASVGGNVVPTIDPVTKRALKDPVKNIMCGHVYGKQAMLEMIQTNPRSRCPMGGCPNPDFIRPEHLKSDPRLTRKVLLKQKQERQQQR